MKRTLLEVQDTNTSITAVEFYNDIIVIGEGSILSAFNVQPKKTIFRQDVLYGNRIHGIRFKTDLPVDDKTCYVAVYGGRSFCVLEVDFDSRKVLESNMNQAEDWIWDLKWNKQTEQLILALAHNSLVLWDILNGTVYQKLTCEEQCILYSACLVGNSWPNVGLLAGTVFKEIVLWTALDREETDNGVPVTTCLQGHLGVIFCICVDTELDLICSTSDDRTARLWKFSSVSDNRRLSEVQFWKEGTFSLMYVLAGHESRVWRASILSEMIITVGEDSKLCFWTHSGSLIRSQKCPGTGLWCISVNKDQNLVAAGGKDGSLALHVVKRELENSEISLPLVWSDEDDFPRTLSLWNCHRGTYIIVTTDSGFVLAYNLRDSKWIKLYENEKLKGFSVLALDSKQENVVIGNLFGCVYWLSCDKTDEELLPNTTSEHQICSGKIHSLSFLESGTSMYVLTCDQEGKMDLCLALKNRQTKELKKCFSFLLPPCKQRWVAAACLYSTFCVIGDRMGSVHVYHLKSSCLKPVQTFKCIHGQDGVTSVQKNRSQLYTTGKDGQICVFSALRDELSLLHRIKTTKYMDWIGKLLFTDEDLLITGFKSTQFVVWSHASQQLLLEVQCGGGHRSWDVLLTSAHNSQKINLIMACNTKNKINFWISQNFENLMLSVLRKGFHGDKIWCAARIFNKDDATYYATGGEDGTVVISKMMNHGTLDEKRLSPLLHLSGHVSSVRALAVHTLESDCSDECILASAGGKAQLMFWKITLSDGVLTPSLLCSNLLWTSDVPPRQLKRELHDFSLPLTRYMDVTLIPSVTGEGLDVFLACSDACIRVFHLRLDPSELSLTACVEEGSWCYLKLVPLLRSPESSTFLTGSTCGTLRLWSFETTSQLTVLDRLKAHSAGINCIHVHAVDGLSTIVGSGGDDNCLTLSSLILTKRKLEILTKMLSPHSSQIIGVHIMSTPDLRIVTAGIDQRVTVWRYSPQSNEVEFESCMCTSITDPAALLISTTHNSQDYVLWLVGGGIQTLRLSIKS